MLWNRSALTASVRRIFVHWGWREQRKAEQPNVPPSGSTAPTTVPKVAIFTVADETVETGWSSVDLKSAHSDEDHDPVTSDPLPRLEHYRTSQKAIRRPSIGELHGDLEEQIAKPDDKHDTPPIDRTGDQHHRPAARLGWIQGVLCPCLLNVWGVMLFLRMSWIVALAGILETLLIIGLSYLVCIITTLSLSALCTNGQVKGGGIYYLISRSLGPEFGGAVGIVLAFANSVSVSMNTIGFGSSLNQLLGNYGLKIVDGGVNDIRIVGTATIVLLAIVCIAGMDWEVKAQNFFVVAIAVAIVSFVVGVAVGPRSDSELAKGFSGLSGERLLANLGPDYRFSERVHQDFFSVLGVFFPSVTGVQAGANICGELKDPAKAIPKGTMLALLVSGVSYVTFVLLAGSAAHRDASGVLGDLVNGTFVGCDPASRWTDRPCEYGLHNDYSIMQLMSLSGALVYVGCFAATLSSALTNLLSVPRIIQALGTDRLYPGLAYFARGYGVRGEPLRAYALVSGVAILFLLLAKLNLLAPLISNFYLASYALINFCTFHAATVSPIGWRPTFRYYNQWVSLFGTVLCVLLMLLVDIIATGITMVLIFVLHMAVIYRKPAVNWGSTTQEQTYKMALATALKLRQIGDHVKNYHPSVLVLAGNPLTRLPLVDLAHQITKHHALMIVGDVVRERLSHRKRAMRSIASRRSMEVRKIRGFYQLIDGLEFEQGVRALIQTSGVGKLAPNIILIGYKADWSSCSPEDLQTYYNVLNDAFDNRMALAILRLPTGIAANENGIEPETVLSATASVSSLHQMADRGATSPTHTLMYMNSTLELGTTSSESSSLSTPEHSPSCCNSNGTSSDSNRLAPKAIVDQLNVFQRKHPTGGTIDVWWLYDDGGLTVLIPYILSLRSTWSRCQVRIFALTNHQAALAEEQTNMANLLAKLRIDYSSLTMLEGVTKPPHADTVAMHRRLLDHWCSDRNIPEPCVGELEAKTKRQLRLREMILENSTAASLIVMSMPMPRLGTVSAPLYMSWLEMLTKDMPPMLLVRGNQTSVLTFYSTPFRPKFEFI